MTGNISQPSQPDEFRPHISQVIQGHGPSEWQWSQKALPAWPHGMMQHFNRYHIWSFWPRHLVVLMTLVSWEKLEIIFQRNIQHQTLLLSSIMCTVITFIQPNLFPQKNVSKSFLIPFPTKKKLYITPIVVVSANCLADQEFLCEGHAV